MSGRIDPAGPDVVGLAGPAGEATEDALQAVGAADSPRDVRTPALRAWLGTHTRTPLYRNTYALVAGAAATSGLGLVYWILAARLYDVEDVGLQSVTISTMLFLAGLAELSLNTVLVRFLPVAGAVRNRLIVFSYGTGMTAGVVVALIFVSGVALWSPSLAFLRHDPWWFAGFVFATGLMSVFALQDSVLVGLGRAPWVPIENAAVSVAKIVLLAALASLAGAGLFISWNVPAVAAVIAVNLFLYRYLARNRSTRDFGITERLTFSRTARFVAGNYAGSLFVLAATMLLPLLVITRTDTQTAAYFFPCWAIATGLQLIAANATLALVVEAVRDRQNFALHCRRALLQTFALMIPAMIGLLLLAPYVLNLFGDAYADRGTALLRWLAVGAVPNVFVALALAVARATDRSVVVASIQGAACVILLAGAYVLLPHGLVGVGIANLLSQSVVAIVVLLTILSPVMWPNLLGSRE
jgi:O-antigen/teichoic acid export membrane protein